MNHFSFRALCVLLALCAGLTACASKPARESGDTGPPPVSREFRAVWIATVANIDWPSRPGLTTREQQDELVKLLDTAEAMNLNAVIFQVRTTADALFDSDVEPWSAYLTGTQGQAPDPAWDPLAFAIAESHARGLELHAWINPLRASHPSYKGELADNHVSRTYPEAVHRYGTMLWMDPGHPDTLTHTLRVVEDLVARYDLDGLHIDDYFYPYPQSDEGKPIAFPDDATYAAYREAGGRMERNDWRRDNVNRMVRAMHETIKRTKPYVKFGISPFGIWRPGHPAYVKGMDQYDVIYADAKKWLEEGWCDYFTPQLYWPIANPDQSFVGLLEWWMEHNPRGRHLWPGLYASRTEDGSKSAFDSREIVHQVRWTRIKLPEDAPGHVHFSMNAFSRNVAGLRDSLSESVYVQKAVTPEMPWIKPQARLRSPRLASAKRVDGRIELTLDARSLVGARWVALQRQDAKGKWKQMVLPVSQGTLTIDAPAEAGDATVRFWLQSFDRTGHASRPVRVSLVPAPGQS